MSYLQRPRLHFAGRFEADVSTVNNDPKHFDNAKFSSADDERGAGATKGWWNPRGTGSWRLLGCRVTAATYADGGYVPTTDPIIGMAVAHNRDRVAPKIVDLDPQQQLASAVWGLQLRLVDRSGADALRGDFAVTSFSDLWNRALAGVKGDFSMGAFFQSVLEGIAWGSSLESRWLRDLQSAAGDGPLSVKLNVDGYSMDWSSPLFATGRIVGTIGTATADEPKRFVLGRHLQPSRSSALNYCVAVIDSSARKLVLDLGNAVPTTTPGGPTPPATLAVAVGAEPAILGQLSYGGDGWYERTAGICEFPADRMLTDDELAQAASTPLQLLDAANNDAALAAEAPNGMHVRADLFVYRLDAGERADPVLYVTRFGARAANTPVACSVGTQGLMSNGPPLGVPPRALVAPSTVTSDRDGVARLELRSSDPQNPRRYIDGQLYAVAYSVDGSITNQFDFISVLVWDAVPEIAEPAWWPDLEPLFVQFGNLYPIMRPIVDLRSYDAVVAKRALLRAVFSLPVGDPNYMPVTRDLSGAKRKLILEWLATTGNNGLPNLGVSPHAAGSVPHDKAFTFAATAQELEPDPSTERGSKTAAVLRTGDLTKQVKL
jgi:hypothetical protein